MSDQTPAERAQAVLDEAKADGIDFANWLGAWDDLSFEDLSALLAQREALLEALRPFAAVSVKAKGSDDACWCGQDGAVIRYRDLRRAAELVALATKGEVS